MRYQDKQKIRDGFGWFLVLLLVVLGALEGWGVTKLTSSY
jgi:hypothetical protein